MQLKRLLVWAASTLAACGSQAAPIEVVPGDTTALALPELIGSTYKGFEGGLYPNASNAMPASHSAEGRRRRRFIVPRDTAGRPSANGKIVLLSIGMSNTTQEFCASAGYTTCTSWSFMGKAAADPRVDKTALRILNGARGGQVASMWEASSSPEYARIRAEGLLPLGLSEQQVQVAWVKVANARPTTALPSAAADAYRLRESIKQISRAMRQRYPNLQMIFLSSRIYAAFATTTLNPEPYAYETGFGVKWAIQDQIESGQYDGPWLAWGPYIWSRSFVRADYETDGTHPSQGGEAKVGQMLLDFFKASEFTSCWFLGGLPGTCT